jgi:hypothetical protein
MNAIESDIRAVERLRGIRATQGRTRTPAEREDARVRLDRAFAGIQQLQPQVEGTQDAAPLAQLTDKAEAARRWLESEGPPSPQRMSILGPEDVAGPLGGPSLTGRDRQLVAGHTGGKGLSGQEQALVTGAVGFPSPKEQAAQLVTGPTGGKVLTERERELVTSHPGVTATELDTGPLLQQDAAPATSGTGQAIATAAPPLTAAAIGLAILSLFSSRPGSPPPAALGSVLPWLGPAVPAGQQG